MDGVGGAWPLTCAFCFLDDGAMAILARASFMEIDRSLLWGAGLVVMLVVTLAFWFPKGSVLRKAWLAGDTGVGGAMCDCRNCDCEV